MSCYDGSEYPFDVTELTRLDDEFFEDALKIIRLRTRCGHEPHEFFIEGGNLFNDFARNFGLVRKSAIDESEMDAPLLG